MIKINLIAQRKRSRGSSRGQQELLLGLVMLLGVGVLIFLFWHQPVKEEIGKIADTNEKIRGQNAAKQAKLADEQTIKAAVENLERRKLAIAELENAQSTPAYMLRELSRIMTGRKPQMTERMSRLVETSPHRQFGEWEPKLVWITKFQEDQGNFTLRGAAQTDSDVTQFAKRLEASVYFRDVISVGGSEFGGDKGGVTGFNFTITGKVVY